MHETDEAKTQNEKKDTRGTLERRKMSMRNSQQRTPADPQREDGHTGATHEITEPVDLLLAAG